MASDNSNSDNSDSDKLSQIERNELWEAMSEDKQLIALEAVEKLAVDEICERLGKLQEMAKRLTCSLTDIASGLTLAGWDLDKLKLFRVSSDFREDLECMREKLFGAYQLIFEEPKIHEMF